MKPTSGRDGIGGIGETRARLNDVSPSFCLAKWLQVTLRLQNGTTHSCHHPTPHKVPIRELDRDRTALHNTRFKKLQRRAMLDGERPPECAYCWNIEDVPGEHLSDRYIKSNDAWARPHLDRIAKLDWKADVNPTYLEVSFSNTCNFKCAYCSPLVSSKWMEEVREHGGYPTTRRFNDPALFYSSELLPIPEAEPNPYIDRFWEWWPELYPTLEVLRITGGEPLLSPHTFRALEYIERNPRPEMELAVNSNLGVPDKLIQKLVDSLDRITRDGKARHVRVFTSLDSWGPQAEYVRYGMDFPAFWNNARAILERLPRVQLVFMCTFNALSVTGFKPYLAAILGLKEEFHSSERPFESPVALDISYLRHPDFLSIKALPEAFSRGLMEDLMAYMDAHAQSDAGRPGGFSEFERAKMRRLLDYAKKPENPLWATRVRKDFRDFITEHDRRRGTSFESVFPELAEVI